MRLLVIGASGLVGSAIAREAQARNDLVWAAARTPAGPADVVLDLADRLAIGRVVTGAGPQAIVVAAGWPDVDGCEGDPDRSFRENVSTMKNLIETVDRAIPIVFLSTDHVFGSSFSGTRIETERTSPMNVYGRHKVMVEDMLLARGRSLIVRTSWVFGRDLRKKSFVHRVVRAAEAKETLRVVMGQTGCPTHSTWLAKEILGAVDQRMEGIVHLSGERAFSKEAWGRTIALTLGLDVEVVGVPWEESGQTAPRPEFVVLRSVRARVDSHNASRVLRETTADYVKHAG